MSTLLGFGGLWSCAIGHAQVQQSLAGEEAAQELKKSIAAEDYNLHVGPVRVQTQASLGFGYTDNLFLSDQNRSHDFLIRPNVGLNALWPVTELNTLRLNLDLAYEYYVRNTVLNNDVPLVNPDSELAFNLFVGDFHIRLHEKFSYQESLFFNTYPGDPDHFYNFNDVGRFSRWDNLAGFTVDWDLNKLILSLGYDHENFESTTAQFEYLSRASEWFSASAAFRLGDKAKVGLEAQGSWHAYDRETVLNDHWRAHVGPFVETPLPEGIRLRAGAGYDTAGYDALAAAGSSFDSGYVYASLRQQTRLFTHSLSAGHENLLGNNANNLRNTYVRYGISSSVLEHFDLSASFSVNLGEEFGGSFRESFTYYRAGLKVGYQFHKYWRGELSYAYTLKNSDLPFHDYYQNRVTANVTFTF